MVFLRPGCRVVIKGSRLTWTVWYTGPNFFRATAHYGRGVTFRVCHKESGYGLVTAVL